MKNIYIVGFMGTGKTTVGEILAKKLGLEFIETDTLIEKRAHCSIAEIFKEKGESCFREIEGALIKEIAHKSDCIVSCGGGLLCNEVNLALLKSSGILVCLTASVDTIYERTKHYRHRPLLNVENPQQAIRALLAKRESFYAQAHHIIDTDHSTPEAITQEIVRITATGH